MLSEHSRPLEGQRALVTGANSGIGAAVARSLAQAGAKVVINYVIDEESALTMVQEINVAGGEAIAIHADVSQEDQVKSMFAEMVETWGSIDTSG